MTNDWPFAGPQNEATFTVRQIVQGQLPILLVVHDADDGGWQFLTGEALDLDDAMLVTLERMLRTDPTLASIAGLPVGWQATREQVGRPWSISPQDSEVDGEE